MKKIWNSFKEALRTMNSAGLRCAIKGDSGIREVTEALKRQKEIDNDK